MLWLLLACGNTDSDKTMECDSSASVQLVGEDFSLPDNACSTFSLESILGEGDLSVSWTETEHGFQPTITANSDGLFDGLVLSGNYTLSGEEPTRLWKQGYQSWWWSGVTDLVAPEFDADGLPLVGGDGNGVNATEEPYSSWWLGLVGKSDGNSILAGALSSTKTRMWTAFTNDTMWVVWGHRGDPITVSAGDTIELDPVWIHAGSDAFDLHVDYARASAAHNDVPARTDKPPVGWATWYTFYEHIDEDIILGNLEVAEELAANPALEPMTVFQIDDGWQKVWGDWTLTKASHVAWKHPLRRSKKLVLMRDCGSLPFTSPQVPNSIPNKQTGGSETPMATPFCSPIWVLASMRLST